MHASARAQICGRAAVPTTGLCFWMRVRMGLDEFGHSCDPGGITRETRTIQ